LPELELTTAVLAPLFRTLGYDRVFVNHGNDEKGADLVCWGVDEIGEALLAVAQVKLYRPSRRAADKRSFSELVNQVAQCLEEPRPDLDGREHLPSRVYVVTPYPVDTKILASRFRRVVTLHAAGQLKIIDGHKLASLVNQKLPKLSAQLLGTEVQLDEAVARLLTNEILLRALEYQEPREVHSFYTDIDFIFGRRLTSLLFTADTSAAPLELELTKADWKSLCGLDDLVKKKIGQSVLGVARNAVERGHKSRVREFSRWKEEHDELLAKQREARDRLKRLDNEVKVSRRKLERDNPAVVKALTEVTRLYVLLRGIPRKERASRRAIRKEMRPHEDLLAREAPRLKTLSEERNAANHALEPASSAVQSSRAKRPTIKYPASLDGRSVATKLSRLRSDFRIRIREVNRKRTSKVEAIKSLAMHCKETVDSWRPLVQDARFARAVGFRELEVSDAMERRYRIRISIHDVFESGMHITVLGDAGAGKTTSLQMYAYKKIHEPSRDRPVLYAPLAQLLVTSKSANSGEAAPRSLEECLVSYIAKLGVELAVPDLSRICADRGAILLLDGIDEVIQPAPWLLGELRRFAESYPRVQLITSSRISGSHLDQIPFFCARLLPFSSRQRTNFFKKWFRGDKDQYGPVLEHLKDNRDVAAIVSNPLLATILCVLAEHGVPLPDSETRLYNQRVSLLLGEYDRYKNISRIRSRSRDLHRLAQKIAFRLHSTQVTGQEVAELQRWAVEFFCEELSSTEAVVAVNELVHPCCVLLPMPGSGKLGFGHLRYQEYLAAKELSENRSIEVLPLLARTWWLGSLVLFAKMNENLDWLLEDAVSAGILSECAVALEEMALAMKSKHRDDLLDMISRNLSEEETLKFMEDGLEAVDY
jgi:hypothetical protein